MAFNFSARNGFVFYQQLVGQFISSPSRFMVLSTPLSLPFNVKKEYFTWKFVKSSGPGGQNVNKTNTKVELRFIPSQATWLSEPARVKFASHISKKLNSKGELVITSDVFKSRLRNMEDAMSRVEDLVMEATYEPPEPSMEQKQRVKKLIKVQNERRLYGKKRNSELKRERNRTDYD